MNLRMSTLSLAALLVLTSWLPAGEKGTLKWLRFDTGLQEAKKSNKKVLIDVYTDWCGWCKKMDANTYNNAAVAEYLANNFSVVRLNAESPDKLTYKGERYTEQQLSYAFGINGYPSTIFLRSDGEPITVLPGYAEAADFRVILSYIAEDHYLSKKFTDYKNERK